MNNEIPMNNFKTCRTCNEVKHVDMFSMNGTHPRNDCKACIAAAHREMYAENPVYRGKQLEHSAEQYNLSRGAQTTIVDIGKPIPGSLKLTLPTDK